MKRSRSLCSNLKTNKKSVQLGPLSTVISDLILLGTIRFNSHSSVMPGATLYYF